jgi:hypothetical protein
MPPGAANSTKARACARLPRSSGIFLEGLGGVEEVAGREDSRVLDRVAIAV